ncbi:tannase and feruloyl esterase-domain-containing protein [Colletotrichum navitas]|uniref:Carboxylic ester hydrolase n=1 Tax=Colletotrichum navitas TaxID=681940 RepID=A0AAD8UZ20_9PEZI|nr:tannase and feruloyl esterase-domain-containing protein [Colletotrichum navitas]KAK1569359.1 tannase and feruloyl esterase-domain-containing protein [Colletotrichum navitas]
MQPLYGSAAILSYLLGCSLGGPQCIRAAHMFPKDYDGIVASAPAIDVNKFYSYRATIPTSELITPTLWKTKIHDEVFRQCDKTDGVEDGIIEDSSLCQFKASTLLCPDSSTVANRTDCLASEQVDITFNLQIDGGFTERKSSANVRTYSDNLSAFKNKGGKLLDSHGHDQQILSFRTPIFYDRLPQGVNLDQARMNEFTRFFHISGMNHCMTGPGARFIGQGGGIDVAIARTISFDREHNDRVPPKTTTRTKFVNNTAALSIDFQRQHWKSPLIPLQLNPKYPDSWTCKAP